MGGNTVSINAAKKTPGYRLSETSAITHSMNACISVNYVLAPSSNNVIQYSIPHNNHYRLYVRIDEFSLLFFHTLNKLP